MVTQFAHGHHRAPCSACSPSPAGSQTWHVYVLAFLFGTGRRFDTPARQAFVNEMVAARHAAQRRRPQLGVVQPRPHDRPGAGRRAHRRARLGRRATGWVILLNGLSYVAVVVSLKRMHSEELTRRPPLARAKGQLRDGVRYVRRAPTSCS